MNHAKFTFASTLIALAAMAAGTGAQAQSSTAPSYPSSGSATDTSGSTGSMGGADAASTTAPADSGAYDTSASTPMAFDPPAAGSRSNDGYSWLPYTTRGYVGISGGQAEIGDMPCSAVYNCDDSSDRVVKAYTGGMFNEYFGIELAYFNTGNIDRNGGRVRAHGGNVSLIAQAPLGAMAAVYAKVGGTYAWTKTSVGPLAVGIASGDESDAGPSYGAGLRINASRNWAFILEWERHTLNFAGDDKNGTKMTTLGVQYRF